MVLNYGWTGLWCHTELDFDLTSLVCQHSLFNSQLMGKKSPVRSQWPWLRAKCCIQLEVCDNLKKTLSGRCRDLTRKENVEPPTTTSLQNKTTWSYRHRARKHGQNPVTPQPHYWTHHINVKSKNMTNCYWNWPPESYKQHVEQQVLLPICYCSTANSLAHINRWCTNGPTCGWGLISGVTLCVCVHVFWLGLSLCACQGLIVIPN